MTEAMSRREIEDILSSIRKLVSHDPARQDVNGPGIARDDAALARPLGKLVLTSALRVAEDPAEAADAAERTDLAGTEPVAARPHAPEPDSAPQPGETTASLLSRITRSVATPAPLDSATSTEAPTTDKAAEPVAEPDPIRAPAAVNIDAAPPPIAADVQEWLDDADIPLPPMPEIEVDPTELALEETLARLEAMLAATDAPSAAPAAPELADADLAEPQIDNATDFTASDDVAPGDKTPRDDAPLIDEAMLYQLVANIVRQELQGELGEKITRAIRKLVRAEVARELQLRGK